MAELEDKFQEILGNPGAMSQIMALAQSLSPKEETQKNADEQWSPVESGEPLLSGLDPAMMDMGMKLLRSYQSGDHKTASLMGALRPFVGEERHKTLDRMAQATKIAKVIRLLLDSIGEKGENNGTI